MKVNQTKVSAYTADLILKLKDALKTEFGSDFSFEIAGNGHLIAANNYRNGEVNPEIKSDGMNGVQL